LEVLDIIADIERNHKSIVMKDIPLFYEFYVTLVLILPVAIVPTRWLVCGEL